MRKNLIAAMLAGLLALGAVACETNDAADPGAEDPGVEDPGADDGLEDDGMDDDLDEGADS